ncbi:MAG: hypothetical protein ABJP66_01715 [Hyphomicrobiales bacterium]
MKNCIFSSILLIASLSLSAAATAEQLDRNQLALPAQGIDVDLDTGIVSKKDATGLCLETVSHAGKNKLVVFKNPGDDRPTVTVNGLAKDLNKGSEDNARLGAVRISRDGSLVHLRSWKTGDKQTELLQDGNIKLTWKRGTSVRLQKLTNDEVLLLVDEAGHAPRLQSHARGSDGSIQTSSQTLIDFGSCNPGRLRFDKDTVWAQMSCDATGKGIYKIPLVTGAIGEPDLRELDAEFVSLPGRKNISAAVASGNQAGLHFYYAVTGLLASQSGEVRACSSDAEGLQSWNQSYRLRALATMFEKTGHSVFADLAVKSMKLTLAAQDGANGRNGPARGWSSKVYSNRTDSRLSLMINQAVIANSLIDACNQLGSACPSKIRNEIYITRLALSETFEADFDHEADLYRISKDIDFRFAGSIAPWNWQVSFAALLKDHPDANIRRRAVRIIRQFLSEWTSDEGGALWRYWPEQYYKDKGLNDQRIAKERYEDTGHAGISLMALSEFASAANSELVKSIQERLDTLLMFGSQTPRDLDGEGPKTARWFPSGGWADYSTDRFREAYTAPVSNRSSAVSVYAYATLFDPVEDFQLTQDFFECAETCDLQSDQSYSSWREFMANNPFFVLTVPAGRTKHSRSTDVSTSKLKIHNQ